MEHNKWYGMKVAVSGRLAPCLPSRFIGRPPRKGLSETMSRITGYSVIFQTGRPSTHNFGCGSWWFIKQMNHNEPAGSEPSGYLMDRCLADYQRTCPKLRDSDPSYFSLMEFSIVACLASQALLQGTYKRIIIRPIHLWRCPVTAHWRKRRESCHLRNGNIIPIHACNRGGKVT